MNFQLQLSLIDLKFRSLMAGAVEECNDLLADEIERRVPVDKGDLKDSIEKHPVKHTYKFIEAKTTVGNNENVDYALSVEYGDKEGPGEAFVRPASSSTEKARINKLQTAAAKALK